MALSGNNTYIGITTINAGTLRMQGMNPMNGAAHTYSISPGAVLHVNGVGTLNKVITINGTGTFRISAGDFGIIIPWEYYLEPRCRRVD